MLRWPRRFAPLVLILTAFTLVLPNTSARASQDRELEIFLDVTGFDVVLESLRLSAEIAPEMLGLESDDFGAEWSRLVVEVFEPQLIQGMALDILSQTLDDDLREHAVRFYGSDLGRRLVAVENKSHITEDQALKTESGQSILEGLRRIDSPRIDILQRLNDASNVNDGSVRAIQEVQIRFLMAAAAAGVIELRMEEADLREAMRSQQDELRAAIRAGGLADAAYTYQAFSDEEMSTYADALSEPDMQTVYALMNAIQFEIMADRFEEIAQRLALMQPSQDL
ncbi:MAG: DUF2059 domain-containing protein [Pseudomonadota bacterium]